MKPTVRVSRYVRVFFIFVFFFVFCFFLISALGPMLVTRGLSKTFPASRIFFKKVSLTPFSVKIDRLEIQGFHQAGTAAYEFKGADISARLAWERFFFNPLLVLDNGSMAWDEALWKGAELKSLHIDFLADIKGRRLGVPGFLRNLVYQKIKADNIKFLADIYKDRAVIHDFDLNLFGGRVHGRAQVAFFKNNWSLEAQAEVQEVDMAELMKALELEKKLKASGFFSGNLRVKINNGQIVDVSADLSSTGKGEFIVKDASLLEQKAMGPQAANIVVENLKNYYYDIGDIKVRNLGQDIKIEISLKGDTGERNLQLIWHRDASKKGKNDKISE